MAVVRTIVLEESAHLGFLKGMFQCRTEEAENHISLHIANSSTVRGKVANVYITELDDKITPYILDNTPPVSTVGCPCLDMDYLFMWPSGEAPFLFVLTVTLFA